MSEFPSLTPEQIQQRLNEFLRQGFAQQPKESATAAAPVDPDPSTVEPKADVLDFQFSPKEIKRHLDRFVIKQDDAKKVLSIAVCDHYNHARSARAALERGEEVEYSKQNVILIGPTNPLFPALRSSPTAVSGASRQKQIPSSKTARLASGVVGARRVAWRLPRRLIAFGDATQGSAAGLVCGCPHRAKIVMPNNLERHFSVE